MTISSQQSTEAYDMSTADSAETPGEVAPTRSEAREHIAYAHMYIYSYLSLVCFIYACTYSKFYWFVKSFSID